MPSQILQPSFAGGVLGPGLSVRSDLAKYDVGMKVGKNVFVHPFGGVSNRAGTEFIAEVPDSTKTHKLMAFKRDDDNNYCLVFGDQVMKVIKEGAYVQDGGSDYSTSTPYPHDKLDGIDRTQSVDVSYLAHWEYFPQKMSRVSDINWTFANIQIDPNVTAPTSVTITKGGSGSETYKYKVSSVKDEVEGFASAEATVTSAQDLAESGAKNTISWTASVDSPQEYNVYRDRNGVFGFIGFTEGTSFVDDNIEADITSTPPVAATVFSTSDDYPSKVGIYQQRLCFGGSINQPETIWQSRTGDYSNFTKSRILRDTDRVELDVSGEEVNTIKGLITLRELLCFTSSGEYSISGPDGVMSATSPVVVAFGQSGAEDIRPIIIDDTALFVDRGGNVRDLRYAFEQDGYTGNDLSLFAYHFFERKTIKGWAYAKRPDSIVWVYFDDGSLVSLTYKREHQVWAWCEHDLGGLVESVAVIPEGRVDTPYFIVKRTINGATKRYVERLHDRYFTDIRDAFFVDCGVTYEGVATKTISGFDHLEGETISALADGSVVKDLVVSGGDITLPFAAGKVHGGLPITADIENLPPAVDLEGSGNNRGRPHSVSGLYIEVKDTRGVKAGPNSEDLEEMVLSKNDLSAVQDAYTGGYEYTLPAEWNNKGSVFLRQDNPLPMTILTISPSISIGR